MCARYRIEDSAVDTKKSSCQVKLPIVKCGYGYDRGNLYRSRRGRWYRVHDYDWCENGRILDYAEWLSPEEAARLILVSGQELPDYPELSKVEYFVSE